MELEFDSDILRQMIVEYFDSENPIKDFFGRSDTWAKYIIQPSSFIPDLKLVIPGKLIVIYKLGIKSNDLSTQLVGLDREEYIRRLGDKLAAKREHQIKNLGI